MNFHLIYHDKNGKFHDEEKNFGCFAEAEIWLKIIEAIDWEIGVPDEWIKMIIKNELL